MRNTLLTEYIFTSVARWKRFPLRVSPQVPECEKVIYGKKIKLGFWGRPMEDWAVYIFFMSFCETHLLFVRQTVHC
jgi:hypothetical protein